MLFPAMGRRPRFIKWDDVLEIQTGKRKLKLLLSNKKKVKIRFSAVDGDKDDLLTALCQAIEEKNRQDSGNVS